MRHVDIVRNDVVAGQQRCVGRVIPLADLGVKLEMEDANLERELQHGFVDHVTGRRCTPNDNGQQYVKLLTDSWQGSLIFATVVHEDEDCAFRQLNVLEAPPVD